MTELSPQDQAVQSTAKRLCIVACAGSGKTTTLIRRVADKVNSGEALASNVAIITFTVRAAEELRRRLATALRDGQAIAEIYTGTIHGFCRHILSTYLPIPYERMNVLTSLQQLAMLSMMRQEWNLHAIDELLFDRNKGEFFRNLATTFDIIKMERIDPSVLEANCPALAASFSQYCSHLRSINYADFADLILLSLNHVRTDATFAAAVRNRAKWLFVDEYQDVDPAQHELIMEIAAGGNLCAIGDDDQAIYTFRGTDPRHFIELAKCAAEVVPLSINFRCRQNIVRAGSDIASRLTSRLDKAIEHHKPDGLVVAESFVTVADEAEFVVSEIESLLADGHVERYGDIAILLRSVASHGGHYINAMRAAGVPFITAGDRSLFRDPNVAAIRAVLEFIVAEGTDIEHLNRLAPAVVGECDVAACAAGTWTECTDSDLQAMGFTLEDVERFHLWTRTRARYADRKFTALLELVLEVVASLKILPCHSDTAGIYNVAAFTNLVQEFDDITGTKNLGYLCGFFTMHASSAADQATPPDVKDAVHVLTVHQAKGLQYSAVFLPMLCDKRFPLETAQQRWMIPNTLFDSARYIGGEEDERRLFYVAVTRAADRLCATCAADVGLKLPKPPSKYFREIQPHVTDPTTKCELSLQTKAHDDPLGISYSAIELYQSCPYRYQLAKVYGIATPQVPFFYFGQVLHHIMRRVHEAFAGGSPATDEQIEKWYDEVFDPPLFVPKPTIELQRLKHIRAIQRYNRTHKDWLANTHAVEMDLEYFHSEATMRGRIDLLLRREDGRFVIVDFKTGKQHEYIDTTFQLGLYSLVANEVRGIDVAETCAFYVEHDEEVRTAVTPQRLANAKMEFEKVVGAIRRESFGPTPGSVCTRCEYGKICPYRKRADGNGR